MEEEVRMGGREEESEREEESRWRVGRKRAKWRVKRMRAKWRKGRKRAKLRKGRKSEMEEREDERNE